MKKIIFITILLVCAGNFALAQDQEKLRLKENHDQMIRELSQLEFLSGIHFFAVFDNLPASVYVIEGKKSVYMEYQGKKFYCIVSMTSGAQTTLAFWEKIVEGGVSQDLKYEISFRIEKNGSGFFVTVDKENSTLLLNEAQWDLVVAKIMKYANRIFEEIKHSGSKGMIEGLPMIGPAIGISDKPIIPTENAFCATGDRQILTKTIYFSWYWGYSSGFKAPPIYKEMSNPIIGFDSAKITQAHNAWNIRIGGTTAGNNVAKVYLANVTYMCYPKFWTSSLSGSIRCVMQK